MIVKYVETSHNGIQSLSLSRYAIGYILRGEKYIYYGDKRHRLSRGDLFYLGMGPTTPRTYPRRAIRSSRSCSTTPRRSSSVSCCT